MKTTRSPRAERGKRPRTRSPREPSGPRRRAGACAASSEAAQAPSLPGRAGRPARPWPDGRALSRTRAQAQTVFDLLGDALVPGLQVRGPAGLPLDKPRTEEGLVLGAIRRRWRGGAVRVGEDVEEGLELVVDLKIGRRKSGLRRGHVLDAVGKLDDRAGVCRQVFDQLPGGLRVIRSARDADDVAGDVDATIEVLLAVGGGEGRGATVE